MLSFEHNLSQIIGDYEIKLTHTMYLPKTGSKKPCILYLHGGGLLYGTRHDLPKAHLTAIVQSGYPVLALSYPLAPSVPIDIILKSVHESIRWFSQDPASLSLQTDDFYLWGRSSGAYLMFHTAEKCLENHEKMPLGLINFYGYSGFDSPTFKTPRFLKGRAVIPRKAVLKFVEDPTVITDDPAMRRIILYEYARQTAEWTTLLGLVKLTPSLFSLKHETFSRFPRSFNTASNTDEDVPFSESKSISKIIPNSIFIPVYNRPHDFDTDAEEPQTVKVYDRLIQWLGVATG